MPCNRRPPRTSGGLPVARPDWNARSVPRRLPAVLRPVTDSSCCPPVRIAVKFLDQSGRTGMSNRGTVTTTVSGLWFGGWLFTIGYAHPHFWQIVLALVIWPYYVGDAVAH